MHTGWSQFIRILGLRWDDITYVDTVLSFGLRSAPKVFSAVADALAWAVYCNGTRNFIHYFLVMAASTEACSHALMSALDTCKTLQFPVAADKTVGPSATLTFLGIQIDTVKGSLQLPEAKVLALRVLLKEWLDRK